MSKRYVDTELWREDWFLSLDGKEQLFWHYICSSCDHAGIWRVNTKLFELASGFRVDKDSFVSKVNSEKERVRVLDGARWVIVGFIRFQYQTGVLVTRNAAHRGAINSLRKNGVSLESMGYEVGSNAPLPRPLEGSTETDTETAFVVSGSGGSSEAVDLPLSRRPLVIPECGPELNEAFEGWIESRRKMRKPPTQRAVNLGFKKVMGLSSCIESVAVEIVNQTVEAGWSGFFPLRTDGKQRKQYGREEVDIDQVVDTLRKVGEESGVL